MRIVHLILQYKLSLFLQKNHKSVIFVTILVQYQTTNVLGYFMENNNLSDLI